MRVTERRRLSEALEDLNAAVEGIDERKYVFVIANSMPEAKAYADLLDPKWYVASIGSINYAPVAGHRTDGYFIAPGVNRDSEKMQAVIRRLELNCRVMRHSYVSHEMQHNWKILDGVG